MKIFKLFITLINWISPSTKLFSKGQIIFIITIICFSLNQLYAQPNKKPYFLAIADLHFDPFFSCKNDSKPCPMLEKLIKNKVSKWDSIFKKYKNVNKQKYYQGTDYNLLESALDNFRKLNPKFVIYFGDFPAHKLNIKYAKYSHDTNKEYFNKFDYKLFKYLSEKLRKTFSLQIPIYPVIGNNDSDWPQACKTPHYCVNANGKFYNELVNFWSNFFVSKDNFKRFSSSFPYAGYYAVTPPFLPKLKIIVLNTVLMAPKRTGNNLNEAAKNELNWLNKQLMLARQSKKRVIILTHIPIGIDVYATVTNNQKKIVTQLKENYLYSLLESIEKYSDIIDSVYDAHIHMNSLSLIKSHNNKYIIPKITIPGLSVVFGNNPGYKLIYYNNFPFRIADYDTYYASLSKGKKNNKYHWAKAYNFKKTYLNNCNDCPFEDGISKLLSKKSDITKPYLLWYSLDRPTDPIHKGYWMPYYWCSIENITIYDYQNCIMENKKMILNKEGLGNK